MKLLRWVGFVAAFFACGIILAEDPASMPLTDSAAKFAEELSKGCIVTGESRDGVVNLGLAGVPPEGADGKPERVAFEIGSITKVFNGLLLASMVTRGELTLDATVAASLGSEQSFDDPRVGQITLRELVTHTSGLPRIPEDLWEGADAGDPYAHYDAKRLTGYLAKVRLEGEPPFDASYSNLGAGLLGHLMSLRADRPWAELIQERVCHPLKLEQTGVAVKGDALVLAPPFVGKEAGHEWHFDALKGAGSLRSTVTDLLLLGQAFVDPDSTPMAKEIRLACKPHAEFPSLGCQIGLGVFIGKRNGQTLFDHGGGTGGYRSLWRVFPSRKLVRVVLVNNSKVEPGPIMAAADPAKKRPTPIAKSEITLSEEQLKRFPGVYRLDRDTAFTVVLHDGGLRVRLSGQPFLKIFPRAPNRFFCRTVEAELFFEGEGESPVSLTLFQNDRELKAKRTDEAPPKVVFRESSELKPYAGRYTMIGGAVFEITLRGDSLFAKLADQPALPVFETGEDEFEYDVVEARLTFTRGDDGQINGLVLHQNGLALPAPRNAE